MLFLLLLLLNLCILFIWAHNLTTITTSIIKIYQQNYPQHDVSTPRLKRYNTSDTINKNNIYIPAWLPHPHLSRPPPYPVSSQFKLRESVFPTVFTVMASKSGNAQTLVISVSKTSLADCVVMARFLCTSVLKRIENKKYPVKISRDLNF